MLVFVLTVILVMPGKEKDISQDRAMPTMEACFEAAKEWVGQNIEKSGGVGLGAGCTVTKEEIKGVDN
jgi:hypothetical protein